MAVVRVEDAASKTVLDFQHGRIGNTLKPSCSTTRSRRSASGEAAALGGMFYILPFANHASFFDLCGGEYVLINHLLNAVAIFGFLPASSFPPNRLYSRFT